MRDSVRNCEADEELKKLFEIFVDRVDVFEGYVTIALNVFYILGFTGKVHSFENEKRPPLDFHQMVVWNGGGDGNLNPAVFRASSENCISCDIQTINVSRYVATCVSN